MDEILKRISKIGIVPVAVIEDEEKAVPLAKALYKGGIDCVEITFRTEQAENAISRISKEFPEILLGAGTVLSVKQVEQAVKAGADFIVTPGYNPDVVNYCKKNGIPIVPGCMETHSIEMALSAGLDVIKFFPAEAAGGVTVLKALSGPYGNLKYMPTGGVNMQNLNDYLSFDKVIACGGSWMVKKELIANNQFEEIENLCSEAVRKMLDFRIEKIVINSEIYDGNIGYEMLGIMSDVAACKQNECCFEISTTNVERAVYHLQKKNIFIEKGSEEYINGKLKAICLEKKIAGFKIYIRCR